MVPLHPGRILRRELAERGLSANSLARALRVPAGRIVDILGGKRAISAETARRLGRYFGNDPRFWRNLQTQYDRAHQIENDVRFLGRIDRARRSLRAGRGVKLEDVR